MALKWSRNGRSLTPACGYAATKWDDRGQIAVEQFAHLFHDDPADSRMAADDRVGAHCNGATNPCGRHACRREWVSLWERRFATSTEREYTAMMMLQEGCPQGMVLIGTRIG